MRNSLIVVLSLILSLSGPGGRLALAQDTASDDFEIPELAIIEEPSGLRSEPQVVLVEVTDDTAVQTVTLYYRFSSNDSFTAVPLARVGETDNYSYTIDASAVDSDALQYYMIARDAAGNTVQRGYAFAPLSRNLFDAGRVSGAAESTAGGVKAWQIVLGVVLVGALAAAAGGGGGGSDSAGCNDGSCVLTITSPAPGN